MEVRSELIGKVQLGTGRDTPPLMVRGWSLEATLPDAPEIGRLAGRMPAGTEIFLSALPRIPLARQIEAARAIRAAGFEPVPHLAARNFVSEAEVADLLEETQARKCLVIAGDLNAPRGPFADSLAILQCDALRGSGVREVAIGGYPEGHPYLGDHDAGLSLRRRIDMIRSLGCNASVTTQFCFDAEKILHWLTWLRGIDAQVPVSIGLAGPTEAAKLLKIALRCWVDLPMRSMRAAPQLLRGASAETLAGSLDAGLRPHHESGPVALHFYSFGGLERTATWATSHTPGQEDA